MWAITGMKCEIIRSVTNYTEVTSAGLHLLFLPIHSLTGTHKIEYSLLNGWNPEFCIFVYI